jgi:hypothetical protein
MNERIKELAAKANFGHMENNEVVYDPRLEKFAELIVKECCSAIRLNDVFFGGKFQGAILKHFGVEE